MRNLFLLIFLLLASHSAFSQKALTGLWTGTTTNDSVTGRKDESFEIALTQYREKVYGYTRRTFIVNDTLYYVLKRVKGKVNGNEAEVTEDEYISYNFAGRAAKGVKTTYFFQLNQQDSSWRLDGRWQTNEVKRRGYSGMGGTVSLKEKNDFNNSELFQQLDELKLDKDVEFYARSKAPVRTSEPEQRTASSGKVNADSEKPKPKEENKSSEKSKAEEEKEVAKSSKQKEKNKEKDDSKAANNKKLQEEQTLARESGPEKKKEPVVPIVVNNKQEAPAAAALVKTTAERVKERVNLPPQLVSFKSDSLQLALYDNGEVDGDTVSVLLNGQVILEKQGLKTIAIKKTIQIPRGQDELTLVLFAENLGKYPPNTGLLVVRDGENVYQVRFSADLSQNATIIFRRQH
ncbi:MAG: hypothetical protein ACK4E0_07765 [Chitinophagaceae bacterium]